MFGMNFVTTGWVFLALPYFLPEIEADLGLSTAETQIFFGAIPLALIGSRFLGGIVSLRYRLLDVVAVGGFLLGSSAVLRGLVPTYAGGIASSLIAGLGQGVVVPCYIAGVAKWFPTDELGLANGIRGAGTTAGGAVGQGLVGPYLLSYFGSWKAAQVGIGFTAVAMTILWVLLYRDPDEDDETGGPGAETPASEASDRSITSNLIHTVSVTDVLLLSGFMSLVFFGVQGFIGMFPTWLKHLPFVPEGSVGFYSSINLVFAMIGTIVIPLGSDRAGRRKPFMYFALVLMLSGMVTLFSATAPWMVLLAAILGGLGGGGMFPIVLSIPGEHPEIGPELSGVAVGLIFAIGQIGGVVGPPLTGLAFDVGTFTLSVAVVGVCNVLALPFLLPLSETGSAVRLGR